ncbi:hypothetical protein SAMN04487843_11123 [Methylobacterium sp. ap11]|uniref:hypothetical protein n=1 Tax=Methylobacterium sp. ap11 TaxID=1761799 RepID=UPI0008B6DB90|nr:hypothetical protein [Methylobacterium sp. ap11]SEP31831.1 hypothetical protein SAMN04487843_11123 [Methylobacterium sp. ap11]
MTSDTTSAAARGEAEQRGINNPEPGGPPTRHIARPGIDYRHGENLLRAARFGRYTRTPTDPLYRPLQVFMMDPVESGYAGRTAVVSVPYEHLKPGPVGAFLEVVPTGVGDPIDLDDPVVAMGRGLRPSVTDPRFRAQMVYAVCADVAAAFSIALGRDLSWGFEGPRLTLVPDAGEVRNAYYDAGAGALRFGSFRADPRPGAGVLPCGHIHTCMSRDIVAHEMTHALLDGMRARFDAPTNPDVLAFHEAFADLVAILQHFTHPEAVREAIERSGGRLGEDGVIFSLAEQFGQATGLNGPLRVALGRGRGGTAPYGSVEEPHERGAILVGAIMEALARVFERRAAPVKALQAAQRKSGTLHAATVELLADLASKTASQFLSLCIRAIDYCPPVDIRFGEYLRALITADRDLVEDDKHKFRQELIVAFAARGIFPPDVADLSEDALLWQKPEIADIPEISGLALSALQLRGDPGQAPDEEEIAREAGALADVVTDPRFRGEFGLSDRRGFGLPSVESVRILRRIGPDRQVRFGLVCEVLQEGTLGTGADAVAMIGGATIILDGTGKVRFVIRKTADDRKRADAARRFAASKTGRRQQRLAESPRPIWAGIHERFR